MGKPKLISNYGLAKVGASPPELLPDPAGRTTSKRAWSPSGVALRFVAHYSFGCQAARPLARRLLRIARPGVEGIWLRLGVLLACLAIALPLSLSAQADIPPPTNFLVNDYAGILSRSEVEKLGNKLRDYVGETSTQIVVVTIESLEGEDPFEYAQRLASAW